MLVMDLSQQGMFIISISFDIRTQAIFMSKATKTNMDGRSRRGPVVTTWKQWQKLTDTDHSSAGLGRVTEQDSQYFLDFFWDFP